MDLAAGGGGQRITLYHSPMACSLASKLALKLSGLTHDIERVRLYRGEHREPRFLAVNPLGKVPAMRVGAAVVTETTAILPLIADLAPHADILPTEPLLRAQANALLGFLSSTVHAAFTPSRFAERFTAGADVEGLRDVAIQRLGQALDHLDARLKGREFLLGALSACDLYLVVLLHWRGHPALVGRLPPTPHLEHLLERVMARGEVRRAVEEDLAERQSG